MGRDARAPRGRSRAHLDRGRHPARPGKAGRMRPATRTRSRRLGSAELALAERRGTRRPRLGRPRLVARSGDRRKRGWDFREPRQDSTRAARKLRSLPSRLRKRTRPPLLAYETEIAWAASIWE